MSERGEIPMSGKGNYTWQPGEPMPPSLAANFRWLHTEGCTCSHMHGSYGRLYGISMGNGWIRTNTHPDCPHHTEGRPA